MDTLQLKKEDEQSNITTENCRSDNKIIQDLETAQKRLDRLSFYNRSYDDVVDDIIKSHHREKHIERLMDKGPGRSFPWVHFMIFSAAILTFGTAAYFFVQDPQVTGSAVQNIANIAANRVVSTSFGMFVVIVMMGLVLHKVERKHKTRHDEFKPPTPPST